MNDAKEGGGVLLLNSVHHIDLLRYYVGNVKRVRGGVCRSVQPQMVNGAEDLAAATLEFENGAIGDVFASWTTYAVPEGASYTVIGSNGTLCSTHRRSREKAIVRFGTSVRSCSPSRRRTSTRATNATSRN